MPIRFQLFIILTITLFLFSCKESKGPKVLVFSKTAEFRHSSIEAGVKAIELLGKENGFDILATEDASYFTEAVLKDCAAVIFLNTTGDVLNPIQESAFERYIQAGGGFVGIHSATDTEYDWPWYNKLVGAYFNGHPKIQEATMNVLNKTHASTLASEDTWTRTDEWYNFKDIYSEIDVLIEMDKNSYEGGTHEGQHPMSWYHEYDGGRSFYTGMGHTEESFKDPRFLKHLLGGIQYVQVKKKLNYNLATTILIPEESRFSNTVLDFNLNEPMEIDEIPGKGILFIERRGALKYYDFALEATKRIANIDVFYGNEDGLIGLAIDPNYNSNNWIYLCYSAPGEISKQHVSRFTLIEDSLLVNSEKILLEVPTDRECCHSGGSLEFGSDGLLYIGLGDNTNPFKSSGFAPIDERPKRAYFDAQRSAANTNDLRGKILRIKPEDDGSYSIPEGNLFAQGIEKTRPEIFAMGLRNPFRFSIDSKTGIVYWGDVGPDAGLDDPERGPKGMGEFNQAKKAGNWGWPYTRGNNQVYNDYDFASNRSRNKFDPNNVVNDSPNNTGIEKLPAAQASMIWFSYDRSEEFPWLGKGGVNPMAGPVFHTSDFPEGVSTFPSYFEDKLFVYEWMRDWIFIVTLDENKNYQKAEPFMPGKEYSHPMDMLFATDGNLYILEYGQSWNTQNMDARLNRVSYISGNRPPLAKFKADKLVGAAPLTVKFSADESEDYDKDKLSYKWTIDGIVFGANSKEVEYTFEKEAVYDVGLEVNDIYSAKSISSQKLLVGNAPPVIKIKLDTENTAYWKGKEIKYAIEVEDMEDGKTSDNTIKSENVKVSLNYIPEGEDLILATIGHQKNAEPLGLTLINNSDCKACHATNKKVNGPSYLEIAEKYTIADQNTLVKSIIMGSHGIWGDKMMNAHPQLEMEETEEMVKYILSLDEVKDEEMSLALTGNVEFLEHDQSGESGQYVLMVSYLDKGSPTLENSNLSTLEKVVFTAPKLEAENADDISEGLGIWENAGAKLVGSIANNSIIQFKGVSYTGLQSINIKANYNADYAYKGSVDLRRDSKDGELLGRTDFGYFSEKEGSSEIYKVDIKPTKGNADLFLVFKNSENDGQFILNADWLYLNYGGE